MSQATTGALLETAEQLEIRELLRTGCQAGKHPLQEMQSDGDEMKEYVVWWCPVISFQSESLNYELAKSANVYIVNKSVGNKIGAGQANRIMDIKDISKFKKGQVLVTDMNSTSPTWLALFKAQAGPLGTPNGPPTWSALSISKAWAASSGFLRTSSLITPIPPGPPPITRTGMCCPSWSNDF
jgi:hypothetical protein